MQAFGNLRYNQLAGTAKNGKSTLNSDDKLGSAYGDAKCHCLINQFHLAKVIRYHDQMIKGFAERIMISI